ncbi:quinoprotein relay system zinc metallohydrolase 2 [Roseibium sp. Sym1]|uniref:quinoprotein relay system zinc metallohydrolase 2 n=1 Tax=Roseibium sp. Sym1 TaxID=3016006 RepID=UPI0022B4DF95|nr:quinoprotein relay system zinc metallohydrolase 2 [Roseibium sp. Sym1]
MFELVVMICLLAQPDTCRAQLVPGMERQSLEECEALLPGLALPATNVPANARDTGNATCRPMGPGLKLTQVAPGVYVHRGEIAEPGPDNLGDVANIGVVVGDTSIAVIDTGGSRAVGEELYRAIRALSPLPVSHVILTHIHPDHVFGAAVFAEAGATIVAHPGFIRAFRDRQDAYLTGFERLIGPQGFLGTHPVRPGEAAGEIDLGGRVLSIETWPAAHSTTDLTVVDRSTNTMFAGDLVFDRHLPALDGSLPGWLTSLDRLAATDAERIVPGHGAPALPLEAALEPMRRYLDTLQGDTRQALQNGERIGEAVEHIAQSESTEWELFDLFNTRNATAAFTELEWE